MKRLLSLLAVVLLGGVAVGQTNITLQTLDGIEHHYTIEPTGGIYFEDTVLYVHEDLNNGQADSYAYSEVRKITLDGYLGIDDAAAAKISLYPNPSQKYIQVTCGNVPARLQIFDMMGRLVDERMIANDEKVDIERLAPGIYLARIEGQSIKFIKR